MSTCAELEDALRRAQNFYPQKMSDVTLAILLRVCIVPLLDQFSLEAWRLYNVVERGFWPWNESFYNQPARFARACEVINAELSMCRVEEQNG